MDEDSSGLSSSCGKRSAFVVAWLKVYLEVKSCLK